jgi:hypothetical protein
MKRFYIRKITAGVVIAAVLGATSPTFAQTCTVSFTCSTTSQPGQPPATTCGATVTCQLNNSKK